MEPTTQNFAVVRSFCLAAIGSHDLRLADYQPSIPEKM